LLTQQGNVIWDIHGPVLVVTPEDWQALAAAVKAGAPGLRSVADHAFC
jgi:hypothetical protein